MKEAAPQPAKKNHKKRQSRTCQKRKKSRACQRKCNTMLLQGHKSLRPPRKMDVLKFIGGRRSKCFFELKNRKKTRFACTRSKTRTGRITILATARQGFCGYYYILYIGD
jgi:hypothetical protein